MAVESVFVIKIYTLVEFHRYSLSRTISLPTPVHAPAYPTPASRGSVVPQQASIPFCETAVALQW